ncbi:MAG: hypothetical protein CW345_08490 [Firmicutes bacterium]|nr:hypothetical protein [Bacillota bacterium]MBO2521825.1 hypothetical protein [Bacillota bacterium]
MRTRRLMAAAFVALFLMVPSLASAQYNEAPMLRALVEQGLLPPVEERLPIPEDIVVIEPVEEIGQYGGTWRTLHDNPDPGVLKMILYDPGVRWNRDYTEYIPGVFRAWEFSEDGRSVTFYLRRGLKWSDGVEFTTEDLRFWWEDLANDPSYGAVPPPWWGFVDGELMTVDFIDKYTIRFNFPAPNWNVPYVLASGFWNWEPMMAPRHYLEQFHPKYNPDTDWPIEMDQARRWWENPDHPVLFAWRPVEYVPNQRIVLERNPYYWKVDTAGNQLPYIDRIVSELVTDKEVRVLRIMAGEVDAIFRGAGNARDLPALLQNAERGNYRHLNGWINGAGAWPGFVVNQDYVGDDYIRNLLRDKNFRRALSVALDREVMNEAIWFGFGTPQQATISEDSWHFASPEGRQLFEEWKNWYAQYDPDLANQLLDAAGLNRRNSQGWRLRADNGQVFELIIDVGDWGGADITAEAAALAKEYWEAVGIRVILNNAPVTEIDQRFRNGLYMVRPVHVAEMDVWTFPDWVFPTGNEVRQWPLQARYLSSGGAQGEPPTEVVQRLYNLYVQGLQEPDIEKRHAYVHEAVRILMEEGPYVIGVVGGLPEPVIVKNNMRNVPNFGILGPWAVGGPGNTNPEQYFFKQ